MIIRNVRHDWPNKAGHYIDYSGHLHNYYSFFHFPVPFEVLSEGEVIKVKPNACILLHPGAYRYFKCENPSIHSFLFISREADELMEHYPIPGGKVFYPGNPTFISEILQKMEQERNSDNPDKERLLTLYLEEFLIKLSRSLQEHIPEEVSLTEQVKMRNLRQEILSQPEKKWTVADMAALASLSPSRFHAVYRSVFGSSPINDLTIARIDYAKSLLRSREHYTLQELTEMLGYQSQCHFINKFKAVTGMTPGAYRKKYR